MGQQIDSKKLRQVQEMLLTKLNEHKNDFTPVEVLFGLVELAGRLTANHTQGTWVEAQTVTQELADHLVNAVKAGLQHRGGDRIITIN